MLYCHEFSYNVISFDPFTKHTSIYIVFSTYFFSIPVQNPGVKTPGFFSRNRMVTEVMPYVLINI